MKKSLLSTGLILSTLLLPSCSGVHHEISEYFLDMPFQEEFKILQLSDIHLANKDDQDVQFEYLTKVIEDANKNKDIDLMITTGDLFTFADKATAKRLFSFFESFQIPWTLTFGNHDEQCYFSIDWLTGYLNDLTNQGSHYCYFKDIQDDDVFGNANFAIRLMDGNAIHSQLLILDSNRYNFGEYIGYDYIKENQIEWFKQLADFSKSNNNGTYVPTFAFFHIPVPEFDTALKLHNQDPVNYPFLNENGESNEGVSCPDFNSGFFTAFKTHGGKAIFAGHDHVNNWQMMYEDVLLSYGVTSTNRIYSKKGMIGAQIVTINDDNTLTISQIFHDYEEIM